MSNEDDKMLIPPEINDLSVDASPVVDEDHVDDEIFENISSQQMRYVQLAVNTGFSRHQIAQTLGVTVHMLTRWDKDPIVSRYMKAFKRSVSKISMEQAGQQSRILNDLAFAEMMSRFSMTPEDKAIINDDDVSVNIRLQVMRKYADGATFRDILEAVKVLGKQHRDDMLVEGEQVEDTLVETVRRTYMKKKYQNHQLNDTFKEGGLDLTKGWAQLVSEDGGVSFTDEQTHTNEEIVEERIQEIQRRSILKKNRTRDDEE